MANNRIDQVKLSILKLREYKNKNLKHNKIVDLID